MTESKTPTVAIIGPPRSGRTALRDAIRRFGTRWQPEGSIFGLIWAGYEAFVWLGIWADWGAFS